MLAERSVQTHRVQPSERDQDTEQGQPKELHRHCLQDREEVDDEGENDTLGDLGAAQLCENDKGHGTETNTRESEDACYGGEVNGAMRLSSRRRDGRSRLDAAHLL